MTLPTKSEIRDRLATLRNRLKRVKSAYPMVNPSVKVQRYIARLEDCLDDLEYDLEYDLHPERHTRDPDREMSYEDWKELSVPCEHPGDSWMGNEDI